MTKKHDLKYIASFLVYPLIITLSVTLFAVIAYIYTRYSNHQMTHNAIIASKVVPESDFNKLTATPEDLTKHEYQEIKEMLVGMGNTLHNVRYIYILGQKDDDVFFFIDSEPSKYSALPNSVPTAIPGEKYSDVTDEFRQAIASKSTIISKPYTDKWGTFVSVLTPLEQAEFPDINVSLGMDTEVADIATLYFEFVLIGLAFSIFPSLMYHYFNSSRTSRSMAKAANSILETISKNSDLMIISTNLDGDILTCNRAAAAKLEYTQDELLQLNMKKLIPPEKSSECELVLQKIKMGETIDSYETQRITKSGKRIDLVITYTPIIKNTTVSGVALTARDISDKAQHTRELQVKNDQLEKSNIIIQDALRDIQSQKNKLEELTNDLQKYKLAVANVNDHIVITDKDGNILYANMAVYKITGFQPNEIIGKKAGSKDLWGGLMSKEFYELLWNTIKHQKKSFEGDLTNKRKDGQEYTAHAKISPVLDDAGEVIYFVGIERDVTKEKEIDKMKTEFISLASHQLRTPLSAIKWFCEMLLNGDFGKLPKEQSEVLNDIYYSNQRMINLVNSLLNISRIESGRLIISPKQTDIKPFVEKVIKEIKQRADDKKHILTVEIPSDIGSANIDQDLIRQVYLNLLTNAIKYTPEGGHIYVNAFKKDNQLVSQVSDNGYGVPDNQKDKIYNKFFRADNAVKIETDGTGLGLYLVKAIVESSGGKIWFESQVDKGTTFWFSLPIEGVAEKKGEVHLSDTE